jgi:2TM domain-containing protein
MTISEEELREKAVKRVKEKHDFFGHLMAYVVVNTAFVCIWALTGADYFWPVWPIVGWGIGLTFHALSIYGPWAAVTEDQIRREMDKMSKV